jgi:hypothetical protein
VLVGVNTGESLDIIIFAIASWESVVNVWKLLSVTIHLIDCIEGSST